MIKESDGGKVASGSTGEVDISVQPEGILVEGEHADVEQYVTRLRELAAHEAEVASMDTARFAKIGGLAAGGTSTLAQSAKFVQLSAESLKALKVGKKIPGDPGFYRMMTRGADGRFLKQLQWKRTSVSPQRLMSVQMIAVQIALSSAIAQVDESVRRVEGKVDAVLQLAEANRAGDVIGSHATVTRMVQYLEKNGSLPDALWDSVANLGSTLAVTVEQLRNHATRVHATLASGEKSVAERADMLRSAVKDSKFAETLDLLIVAEESLYKWQRLVVARVRATQPDHVEQVIAASRELLAAHLELDGQLYQQAKAAIEAVARREDIDGFRFWSVQKLTHDRDTLSKALDDFARARHHQAQTWKPLATPGIVEATSATVDMAIESTGRAIAGAGAQLIKIGDYLREREQRQGAERGNRDQTAENE